MIYQILFGMWWLCYATLVRPLLLAVVELLLMQRNSSFEIIIKCKIYYMHESINKIWLIKITWLQELCANVTNLNGVIFFEALQNDDRQDKNSKKAKTMINLTRWGDDARSTCIFIQTHLHTHKIHCSCSYSYKKMTHDEQK